MEITKLSNEELVNQLVSLANSVSVVSESNYIWSLREEALRRMEAAQQSEQVDGAMPSCNCESCNSMSLPHELD